VLETIKSYLVSLGFEVDKGSYDQTKKAIDSVDVGLTKFAGDAIKNLAKASTAVAAFGVAAVVGTAKFLNGLGNQEIQMEILSRQLWTTQQQAQAFNATLKSMGATLQELYLSPTLMKQYQQLHQIALQMATPTDYKQQIQMIQNVQLQFKQMKLEAYYALQWIGYYFIKYMSGPISKVHDVLQSINNVIIKNMPTWTKKVAEVMASFVQAGYYIGQALGKVYTWLKTILQYVPGWAKGIAAALAILSISNPFMLFIEGIGAAILLLDDFETYLQNPSKSAFPQLWAWVVKTTDALKKMGIGKKIAGDIKTSFDWLGSTMQKVKKFTENMYTTFQKNGTIKAYTGSVSSLFKAFSDLWGSLGNVITGIGHLFGLFNNSSGSSGLQNFFQLIADLAIGAIKELSGAIEELSSLANLVGDALHGDWKGASQVLQNMWTGQNLANTGIISQSDVTGAKGPAVGPPSYPYMFQNTGSSSSKTTQVNAPQTVNVYGSNPQSVASAIQQGYNRHLYNLRGVMR